MLAAVPAAPGRTRAHNRGSTTRSGTLDAMPAEAPRRPDHSGGHPGDRHTDHAEAPRHRTAEATLAGVGARLHGYRTRHRLTLVELAASTGISVSTLSRLESGQRKPTLELLLPLALRYQVPLDELVGAPPIGDPRVRTEAVRLPYMTAIPLTREPGGLRAYKLVIPRRSPEPEPRSHEGWEWMYVLSGRLRVVLGPHDIVMRPGEAAEFDTHVPHWFGSADPEPCEVLVLFGPQGERMHVRARSRGGAAG
jgi:transcriptional regulator with XRE-family HTH domain